MGQHAACSGKVALVTGGASGIGQALAETFAARGGVAVVADRQVTRAEEVVRRIEAAGGRAASVELDVREADAFGDVAHLVRGTYGRIDYLFNNAGIAIPGLVVDYERADWDDVLDVNVRGVANGVQAVYPIMVEQRAGHIVNTASVAGLLSVGGMASYVTSKHAVVGLTKALRIEARGHGVRVSALCPGVIRTPILSGGEYGRSAGREPDPEALSKYVEKLRPMDPAALAAAALDEVDANEPFIVIPRWWRALWVLERFSPRLALRIYGRLFADMEERIARESSPTADIPDHTIRA